jgi:hypothetical protein
MIYATRNSPATDPSRKSLYWLQTRSSWESALKAHAFELTGRTDGAAFLETCGSHSAFNCLMATAQETNAYEVVTLGGYSPRTPDLLTDFFNRPSNQAKFSTIIPGVDFDKVFENEYAQLYPYAVEAVFGVSCRYQPSHRFDDIVEYIKAGQAVQIVLITPGHYLAVHAYDDFTDELIYVDPNDRTHPDGQWFNVRMPRATHDTNVKPHIIVY